MGKLERYTMILNFLALLQYIILESILTTKYPVTIWCFRICRTFALVAPAMAVLSLWHPTPGPRCMGKLERYTWILNLLALIQHIILELILTTNYPVTIWYFRIRRTFALVAPAMVVLFLWYGDGHEETRRMGLKHQ